MDKYLNVELILDVGSANKQRGRVAKRSRRLDGEAVGHTHANPFSDTKEYEIEFTDGSEDKYTANIISRKHVRTGG